MWLCEQMPEFMIDQMVTQHGDGEIKPNDKVEDKTALTSRFARDDAGKLGLK